MAHEKWTQRERDAACIGFSKDGIWTTPEALNDENLDAVIDLACQRNALRDALKKIMPTLAQDFDAQVYAQLATQAHAALAKCKP